MFDWVFDQLSIEELHTSLVKIISLKMTPEESTIFTLAYILLSFCLIAPPTEFVSAGLTIQNLLSSFLGSEELNFIYYHVKRTTATLVVHSFLPLGYYLGMAFIDPQLNLLLPWRVTQLWQMYFLVSITLPMAAGLLAFYWSRKCWDHHPISKKLGYLSETGSWRSVASSVNIEFRRINKFVSGPPGRRVFITDSWVLKTTTYNLFIAHQNDIHLTLTGTQEHDLSHESLQGAQYLSITVASVNPKIAPFIIRLNSTEYNDLKDRLSAPVRNARNIVIRQSTSDRFVHAFKEQVLQNSMYRLPVNVELESCIGCLQVQANTKLQKLCNDIEAGECTQCFCRPMWCLDCMGKWFASRQEQQRPEMWMSGKAPCPMCRAKFCVLDVCKVGR